jgi:hypothetical protein
MWRYHIPVVSSDGKIPPQGGCCFRVPSFRFPLGVTGRQAEMREVDTDRSENPVIFALDVGIEQ